tara:strand:- start:403 stop:633 length:231 start_codon:yes stop_codon:yes gene_type:complete
MGCGCGKNKKYPRKKSSRMPMKKPSAINETNINKQDEMSFNDRRTKIIKIKNNKKIKDMKRQQVAWQRYNINKNRD